MTTAQMGRTGAGVAFVVSAGVVYEIIAAACSSPQTTEINADKRAETLMKWVHLGLLQALAFVVIAALITPRHRVAILSGGASAGILMYVQYAHAKRAGLRRPGESTET